MAAQAIVPPTTVQTANCEVDGIALRIDSEDIPDLQEAALNALPTESFVDRMNLRDAPVTPAMAPASFDLFRAPVGASCILALLLADRPSSDPSDP